MFNDPRSHDGPKVISSLQDLESGAALGNAGNHWREGELTRRKLESPGKRTGDSPASSIRARVRKKDAKRRERAETKSKQRELKGGEETFQYQCLDLLLTPLVILF
jgi:hypothetical protein